MTCLATAKKNKNGKYRVEINEKTLILRLREIANSGSIEIMKLAIETILEEIEDAHHTILNGEK